MAAAAPMTALRMIKDLRLMFEGIAESAGNAEEGALLSVLCGAFILASFSNILIGIFGDVV
jgi:hypothetical protein